MPGGSEYNGAGPDAAVLEYDNIKVVSLSFLRENIVVRKGGDTLKVMLNNRNDYGIMEDTHMGLLYLERKDSKKEINQTIYITIPENAGFSGVLLTTESGSITVSDIRVNYISASSYSGSISLDGNAVAKGASLYSVKGNVSVKLPDSIENYRIQTDNMAAVNTTINGRLYREKALELNPQGEKRLGVYNMASGALSISDASFLQERPE